MYRVWRAKKTADGSSERRMTTRKFKLKRWEPKEQDVLNSVLQYLAIEKQRGMVVWFERMNSGATRYQDRNGKQRFVRYGFKGCPDIHGMLADGRPLYLEVKKPSGRVQPEQREFIERAVMHGAAAAIVRSVEDAVEVIRAC